MQQLTFSRICGAGLLTCLLFCSATSAAQPAEKPEGPETTAKPAEDSSQQALRSYLQLQEQLHAALLAIERGREDAEAAAKRNAETVAARLKLIEQAITLQREREMESIQSSNRFLLIVAGIFAGAGFLALLLTSLFQLRAMNRLAEIAATFPAGHGLGQSHSAVLSAGDSHLVTAEQSSTRLLGVIERLEKRVLELEHTAHTPAVTGEVAQQNGVPKVTGAEPHPIASEATAHDPHAKPLDRIPVMLGKGQALLNLDQTENALACFEEVIALDPNNAEALVKKGTALERLKRLEEAIQCYDRAIAMNQSMTLAYLYKGGVYNQMERFNEALECYEQALRTQEKAPVA